MYSDKVMDHFSHPRNVGVLKTANGVGELGDPACGDLMKIYIRVENGVIEEIKFKTFGCAAAIATSSMVTVLAQGQRISEALMVTNEMVAEALGGLPAEKMHCSNLAADALSCAISDYQRSQR